LEDKVELEILGLSSSQSQTGSFALILGEVGGRRRLPIIIGMFEAQAIAIEIEEIAPNRPMTHDLFKTFADGFDIKLDHIFISDLKEGIFFAKINTSLGEKKLVIDSRPSDAIAISLRFEVPIYTNEKVLSEAGIIISEEEETEEEGKELVQNATEILQDDKPLTHSTVEELNILLEDALKKEDYEVAAKVRDEINRKLS
jgi:bifunctional DNase/RNase